MEIAPLRTKFEIRVVALVLPVLKKLKGYHKDRAIPEYINKEIKLSAGLNSKKLPYAK